MFFHYKNKIGRVVVFLLVCGVGLEIALRVGLGLGNPPLLVEDPEIEYYFKPRQDILRFGKRFKVNEWGMRSESFAQEVEANEQRIIVFGDSVINGGC